MMHTITEIASTTAQIDADLIEDALIIALHRANFAPGQEKHPATPATADPGAARGCAAWRRSGARSGVWLDRGGAGRTLPHGGGCTAIAGAAVEDAAERAS